MFRQFRPILPLGHPQADAVPAVIHAEAEELASPRPIDRALLFVDLEPKPLLEEPPYSCHDPVPCPFRADVDVAIVRITDKTVSPPFQLFVQVVEKDVGQERAEGAALGCPLVRPHLHPTDHHAGLQIAADQHFVAHPPRLQRRPSAHLGLRSVLPARPDDTASPAVPGRRVATLPPASFGSRVATGTLAFG